MVQLPVTSTYYKGASITYLEGGPEFLPIHFFYFEKELEGYFFKAG